MDSNTNFTEALDEVNKNTFGILDAMQLSGESTNNILEKVESLETTIKTSGSHVDLISEEINKLMMCVQENTQTSNDTLSKLLKNIEKQNNKLTELLKSKKHNNDKEMNNSRFEKLSKKVDNLTELLATPQTEQNNDLDELTKKVDNLTELLATPRTEQNNDLDELTKKVDNLTNTSSDNKELSEKLDKLATLMHLSNDSSDSNVSASYPKSLDAKLNKISKQCQNTSEDFENFSKNNSSGKIVNMLLSIAKQLDGITINTEKNLNNSDNSLLVNIEEKVNELVRVTHEKQEKKEKKKNKKEEKKHHSYKKTKNHEHLGNVENNDINTDNDRDTDTEKEELKQRLKEELNQSKKSSTFEKKVASKPSSKGHTNLSDKELFESLKTVIANARDSLKRLERRTKRKVVPGKSTEGDKLLLKIRNAENKISEKNLDKN